MIVPLHALESTAKDGYGSKAWRLFEASQRGYHVAAGIVVPSGECETLIERWQVAHAAVLSRLLREASPGECINQPEVGELSLPAAFTRELVRALEALRPRLGDSPLIVRSSAQAEDAPASSRAGQFHSEANVASDEEVGGAICRVLLSYLWHRARGLTPGGMAIIIQEQVAPDLSGVAFSCNPLTGDPDEAVIVYREGECGGVTDGAAPATQVTICLSESDAGAFAADCPPVLRPFAAKIVHALTDLEQVLESPVDIEWAGVRGEFYLLQVRPVTMVAFREDSLPLDGGSYERCAARPVHRHSWHWIAVSDQVHADVLPRFGERHVRVAHHEVNGYLYRAIRVDRSQFDKNGQWQCALREGPAVLAEWEAERPRVLEALRRLNRASVGRLPLSALKAHYREVVRLVTCAQRMHDTIQRPIIAAEWWVWELAERLAGYSELQCAALLDEPGPLETEFRERLGALDDEAVPDRDLQQIACEFGYQFASFDELYSPLSWRTWEEDPTPLRLLCQMRRQAPHTGETEARRQEVLAARGALLARAEDADPEAAALLRQVLDLAVQCMATRADKDLCLSFAFAVHRKYLLELGARVFGGEAPERMFEAMMEEVLEFCACEEEALPPPTQAAVARRCRHHHVFAKMVAPLTLPVAPEAEPRAVRAGDVIEGSPGAAGTAVGRVRVLQDIRETGALQRGEVMVTADIKPAWALAFGLASGIITANGHLLAHGAIMAREAGIPCVFIGERIDGLRTGDRVRVIGEQGRVEILSHAS